MSHPLQNSLMNSYFSQTTAEKEKRDAKKELEHLSNLLNLMQEVEEIVAESSTAPSTLSEIPSYKPVKQTQSLSSTTGTTTDYVVPKDCPSAKECQEALAAMSKMIGELQEASEKSTDVAYQISNQIMIAQLQSAMQILQIYMDAADYAAKEWELYEAYMKATWGDIWVVEDNKEGIIFVKQKDSDFTKRNEFTYTTQKMEADIEKWVKDNLGITIHLDRDQTDPNKIIEDANNQVKKGLDNQVESAALNVYNAFILSCNPVLKTIGKMLFDHEEFSAEAIAQLEKILIESVEVITLISSVGSLDHSSGPSNDLMMQIVAIMTQMVNQLEATVAKTASDKATCDGKISNAENNQAKDQLDKINDQLKKINEALRRQKDCAEFSKIAGIFLSIVMVVVSLGAGLMLMAGFSAIMLVLNSSGAMDKMKDDIASSIKKDLMKNQHMSEEKAEKLSKVYADVVVIVVVAAAVVITGGISSLATGATTAAEAGAAGAEAAEAEVQPQVEIAAEQIQKSALEKALEMVSQLLGKINIFNMLPSYVNMGIASIAETVNTTNLATDATIANNGSSKDCMINSIVVGVFGMLVGGLSMSSAASQMETQGNNYLSQFLKSCPKSFQESVSVDLINKVSDMVMVISTSIEVGADIELGLAKHAQAHAEYNLGKHEADLIVYNEMEKEINQQMKDSYTSYMNTIKSHQETDRNTLSHMFDYQAVFTQLLSQRM